MTCTETKNQGWHRSRCPCFAVDHHQSLRAAASHSLMGLLRAPTSACGRQDIAGDTLQNPHWVGCADMTLLTLSPNFCCSSACFPMCSCKKTQSVASELQNSREIFETSKKTPQGWEQRAGPSAAQEPPSWSPHLHGPQQRNNRFSFEPASSSPSGSFPAVRPSLSFPAPGRPPCSNPPPTEKGTGA